jgi:hypothetical protein
MGRDAPNTRLLNSSSRPTLILNRFVVSGRVAEQAPSFTAVGTDDVRWVNTAQRSRTGTEREKNGSYKERSGSYKAKEGVLVPKPSSV